jgi:hypothetical protein
MKQIISFSHPGEISFRIKHSELDPALTAITMAILRQYVFPFLIVVMFLVALLAVSARIFLPADMAAPAPTGEVSFQPQQAQLPGLATPSPTLSAISWGLVMGNR